MAARVVASAVVALSLVVSASQLAMASDHQENAMRSDSEVVERALDQTQSAAGVRLDGAGASEGRPVIITGPQGTKSRVPKDGLDGVTVTGASGETFTIKLPIDETNSAATIFENLATYEGGMQDTTVGVQVTSEGDPRLLVIIDSSEAPSTFDFPIGLLEDSHLHKLASGEVAIVNPNGVILGAFQVPFAVDADGRSVPTHFEVSGHTLVQVVDHESSSNFTYPIVADPYFLDQWMNDAEFSFCKWPSRFNICNNARIKSDAALARATALYPSSLHNGKGDAFRHCYWSATMTIQMGSATAKGFGDRHEDDPGNPLVEKEMDLANNSTGRTIGDYVSTDALASSRCKLAADAGSLKTL